MGTARDARFFFHLQVAAGRVRAAADRRCLAGAGVTTAQAAALTVISRQPGVSQRALAAALRQTEPSITTLVRRLLAAGLVERSVHAGDGRARALAVTQAGLAALATVDAAFAPVNDRIEAALSAGEIRGTAAALRRLTDAFDAAAADPPAGGEPEEGRP